MKEYHYNDFEEQNDFRAGRSTIDGRFCLSQVIEKRIVRLQEVHLIIVDLEKAHDTVPVSKLWAVLKKIA